MPKKTKINVIIHHGENREKEELFIGEAIANWYVGLVRRKLIESELTPDEKCSVLDMLIEDIKKKEINGAVSFAETAPCQLNSLSQT